jgi:hypothetical protein
MQSVYRELGECGEVLAEGIEIGRDDKLRVGTAAVSWE